MNEYRECERKVCECPMSMERVQERKMVAGIFALLLGSFGVHKFYLGYTKAGLLQMLLSFCCGIGGLIALIEGIIYLTTDNMTFYERYIVNKRPWF